MRDKRVLVVAQSSWSYLWQGLDTFVSDLAKRNTHVDKHVLHSLGVDPAATVLPPLLSEVVLVQERL